MKQYTIKDTLNSFKDKTEDKTTSRTLVEKKAAAFEEDKKSAAPLNAFLEIYSDAPDNAQKCDEEREAARTAGTLDELLTKKPLLGVPFAVKDNISVKGKTHTCGSHILEGYTAPYSATVIRRLVDAGAVPLGRCNQDEFAMGSSTEYSAYGPTRNPVNRDYVSGGSSGGSAAAVASGMVPFALGTETGGSLTGFLLRRLRIKADLRFIKPKRRYRFRKLSRSSRHFRLKSCRHSPAPQHNGRERFIRRHLMRSSFRL